MVEERVRQKVDEQAGGSPFVAPRRQPFAHGNLPGRPNYNPEEGEGGSSEIWAAVGGLGVALLVIFVLGWLIAG